MMAPVKTTSLALSATYFAMGLLPLPHTAWGSSSPSSSCLEADPDPATAACTAPTATGHDDAAHHGTSWAGTLIMAPSSIPHPSAGLGVYTTVDIPKGSIIGSVGTESSEPLEDMFVVIDDPYKTLPYRGQRRFASWLSYIWPEETNLFYPSLELGTFPEIPESFHRLEEGLSAVSPDDWDVGVDFAVLASPQDDTYLGVSAFAPGLASLANSHQSLSNIEMVDKTHRYVSTPNYGVTFAATRDIEKGEELLLNYGSEWHATFDSTRGHRANTRKIITDTDAGQDHTSKWVARDEAERKVLALKRLPTEEKKRRQVEVMGYSGDEVNAIAGGKRLGFASKRTPNVSAYAVDDMEGEEEDLVDGEEETGNSLDDGDDSEIYDDQQKEKVMVKSIDWLTSNGAWIDNIRAGPSELDPAGMGAYAQTFTSRGSTIASAPLLAILRDDLNIYEADMSQENLSNVLNLDKIMEVEPLLNFCIGDRDSPLLLLPYSPTVNFINHRSSPNAEIRWPSKTSPFYDVSMDWLSMHPLDVQDHSGKLMMEYVAIKDINPGDEILIDYGQDWQNAWNKWNQEQADLKQNGDTTAPPFRHEIGVPKNFFPPAWINASSTYEVAPAPDLKPGELAPITFAHNGQPIAKNLYRAGMPRGSSTKMHEYSDRRGFTSLYGKLLNEDILNDNEFQIFEEGGEQWFAHRYKSGAWGFNMHYMAPWDEGGRQGFLRALAEAGFDTVLEGTAKHIGLENMTCFHVSFMAVSRAEKSSFMHADVYSSGEKGFNYIFPVELVEDSPPELDIQTDDFNVIVGVNYEYDVAYALGDWVYHRTRGVTYDSPKNVRIVISAYCSQIDADNAKMLKHIYNGEDPAPFMDQFELPLKETHCCEADGNSLPKQVY